MDLSLVVWYLFCLAITLVGGVLVAVLVYLLLTTKAKPNLTRFESEKIFINPKTGKSEKFPSVWDKYSVDLSVVVPAYNEQDRIPKMLDEALEYLEKRQKSQPSFSYEVIIVDDGSKDNTTKVGLEYAETYTSDKIRVLTFVKNRGKGGAVRMGVNSARGKYILFADADGATKFEDLSKLVTEMDALIQKDESAEVICVGSRAHLEEESIAERSFFRTLLMKGFHILVWLLCVKTVKDTQCGFKLLSRTAAQVLFSSIHLERWAFDVEMLYIAEQRNMKLKEVAVRWEEIAGSKITPLIAGIQMGRDLVFIRLRYMLGLWTFPTNGATN